LKKILLNSDVVTGWVASTLASIVGVTEELHAGNLISAVMAKFPSTKNEYITYTFVSPISVSGYTDIVLHIVSQSSGVHDYRKSDDFNYKIDFGSGTKEYYLPVYDTFGDVKIHIEGMTTIERIRITKITDGEDYIAFNYFVLSKDEFPLDIYTGIKEQLEYFRDKLVSISLGKVTNLLNATSVTVTGNAGNKYLNRYACLRITDGTNTEYHQIIEEDGNVLQFSGLFSGPKMLHAFTNADVYLYYPVLFETTQEEAVFPSLAIWGMDPELPGVTNGLTEKADTFKTDGTFNVMKEGLYTLYPITISAEAVHRGILAALTGIIRRVLGQHRLWINGMDSEITLEGAVSEEFPTEHIEMIPKIEYPCVVGIKEDVWDRTSLVKTLVIDSVFDIT